MQKNRTHQPQLEGLNPVVKIGPEGPLCVWLSDCYPCLERQQRLLRLYHRMPLNGAEYTDGPLPRQAICTGVFSRFFKGVASLHAYALQPVSQ